ncbi:MAG: gamma carbonic anhydrase family protein [Pseudomonadaceae bacterium]|nr:gamma carbonic anhydrase family protein [Pseudomonadaceae bacterium]
MGANIRPYQGIHPTLGQNVFVADSARVIGDTHVGSRSSVWFGAVLRGDVNRIRVGEMTNIQENAVCHVTYEKWPLIIGNRVTIGHGAIVHGCQIHDDCLIGMGSKVLDGAVVQAFSMVAAGALVSPGKVVESGWLWAGVPAKPVRRLTDEERAYIGWSAPHYAELGARFRAETA